MSWFTRLLGNEQSSETGRALVPVNNFGEAVYLGSLDNPNIQELLNIGNVSSAGEVINEATLYANASMFRAFSLICGAMGMLPLGMKRRTYEGEKPVISSAPTHPAHKLLARKPNDFQTPFEFKTGMQQMLIMHGNAYAFVSRNSAGLPMALWPLDPRRVEFKVGNDFKPRFIYTPPEGGRRNIDPKDMFWLRAPLTRDGINGMALLKVAREALGIAKAAERGTGNLMRRGALVGGVLEHPKALTKEAIARLREQWEARHEGVENQGKWVVAEDGMKVKEVGNSARDAQVRELRQLQVEEIARFTGVPRPFFMLDETSWGSGIEQLGLFLITYCLMPYFVAWEQAISRTLVSDRDAEMIYAKFNEGALLRGSLKDQSEFFAKALGSGGSPGWFTQDEVREKFDMNPKGADELPSGSQNPNPGGDPPEKDEEKDDGEA